MGEDNSSLANKLLIPAILIGCSAFYFDGEVRSFLFVICGIISTIGWYLSFFNK